MTLPIFSKPNRPLIGQMPRQVRFRVGEADIQGNRPLTMIFPNGKIIDGLVATPKAIQQILQLAQQQAVPQIITPKGGIS